MLADTALGGTFPSIADFDLDGLPEVVVVDNAHGTGTDFLHLRRHNALMPGNFEVLRQNLDLNNGNLTTQFCGAQFEYGGGPPTVADFDGDGTPDVGVAGAVGYVVFSGRSCSTLTSRPPTPCCGSSRPRTARRRSPAPPL